MQWFAGNVTTAIQISRMNKALLIVYITTDSEDGRFFDEFWQHVDTANLLCPVVGIKLKAGETAASQFADIYPTPIVPAAYLIDLNGKPLEVITTLVGKSYDQFRSKFDRATTQFINDNSTQRSQTESTSIVPSNSARSEGPPVVPEALHPQVSPSEPPSTQAPQVSSSREMTPEVAEKVARARALLEQKKQKDAEKKRETEKQMKEEVAKAREAKQERDDKALMEAAKQRKKEKMEASKEKERILAQIKADREDAQKRFGTKSAAKNTVEEASKPKDNTVGKAIPSDRCRLQIRMPDGSAFVEEFPSNDVLNSLIEIIRQKPHMTGTTFEVQQPYPRRVFTTDDYSKTFLDNQLTPSTSLIVILKTSTTSTAKAFAVSTPSVSIFSWLIYPITAVWGIFCSLLGWNATSSEQSNDKKKENTGATRQGTESQPSRRGMPRSAEVRRRGNVAGLENPNDDDPEERASFNGNSTQFM